MIPQWLHFKDERHPFRDVHSVIMSTRAMPTSNFILNESSALNKELGGIGCYHGEGTSIVVDDLIQVRSSMLRKSSFSLNPEAIKSASEFHCSNKMPLIFHTHPSGSPDPSVNDRSVSVLSGTIGCIMSGAGTRCYAGTRDIPVMNV